jgi:Armadillo/beta-catenin-like repeat
MSHSEVERVLPLIAMLRDGTDEAKGHAAGALRKLALEQHSHYKVAIACAGGIPPLIALLRDGNDKAKERAAGALANLSVGNADNRDAIVCAFGVPALIALLRDGTNRAKENAATGLRNLLDPHDVAFVFAGSPADVQEVLTKEGAQPPAVWSEGASAYLNVWLTDHGSDHLADVSSAEDASGLQGNPDEAQGTAVHDDESRYPSSGMNAGGDRPEIRAAIRVLSNANFDNVEREFAVNRLRILVSDPETSGVIAHEGGIPLIALLQGGASGLKEEGTAAQSNLASGNADDQVNSWRKASDEDRFNPQRLKELSEGDTEFESELVELFNEAFDESLQKLVAALDTSDKDEANAILCARDIKGETIVAVVRAFPFFEAVVVAFRSPIVFI